MSAQGLILVHWLFLIYKQKLKLTAMQGPTQGAADLSAPATASDSVVLYLGYGAARQTTEVSDAETDSNRPAFA